MRKAKMGGGMMVPPEREEYQIGSIVKLAAKGASSLLKGAKKDSSQSLKSLEKKLTATHPDKNVITFTEEELIKRRKEIGDDDAFEDFLSEFSIVRETDEAIADLSNKEKISFQQAEKLYKSRIQKAEGGKLTDLTGDGKVTQADVLKGRGVFQEGGEVPVDTYPNIPPEEMAAAQASQLPDQQMEDEYITYVMNEALDQEEQMYLMNALEGDPQLSMIFDKVVDTASEFTGSGEVAGPGTGVSDSIPARLSDGEFVMTRKATDQIGADRLQTMMDEAERAYDGGLMRKDEDTDIEDNMNKVMMTANQMPSLNIRQR